MARIKPRKNRIVGLALIVFTVYIGVSLTLIHNDVKAMEEETAQVQADIEEQTILNEEMQNILDQGIDDNYIIKIARERLNFVYPEERVYKDVHKDTVD